MSMDPQEHKPIDPAAYDPLQLVDDPVRVRKPLDPMKWHRYLYASVDPVNMLDPRGREDEEEEAGAIEKSADQVEQEVYQLKTLERYEIQQSWGVEAGESGEDGVSGNNINADGSRQFVRNLLKDLMDEWNNK